LSKSNQTLAVFIVWEPVLRTDVRSPTTRTLAKLWDQRVKQFWDKDRLIAAEIKKSAASNQSQIAPKRQVPLSAGFLWDAVAVFGPGKTWEGTMPQPEYIGGAVVNVVDELRTSLAKAGTVSDGSGR